MSNADFYRVLGVKRSADSDEIKAAFRELVKRHHPDLFSTRAEKERATETLRQINEAYGVLGNPQRRRAYDQTLAQEPAPRNRPPRAPRRRKTVRVKPKAHRTRRPRFHFPWTMPSTRKLAYAFGAVAAALLLFFATRTEPRWSLAWALVEKVEDSPADGGGTPQQPSEDWSPLAQFESAPDCAGALKAKVREDERQGAKAIFDERSGMMAITVRVEAASGAVAKPDRGASAPAEAAASPGRRPAQPVLKRVRNLECRALRRMERLSWMQRALRRAGLGL